MCIDFAVVLMGLALFMLVVSLVYYEQEDGRCQFSMLASALLMLVGIVQMIFLDRYLIVPPGFDQGGFFCNNID